MQSAEVEPQVHGHVVGVNAQMRTSSQNGVHLENRYYSITNTSEVMFYGIYFGR